MTVAFIPAPGPLPVRAGWQDRALCAQTDPEAFFPAKGGSHKAAKQVCACCEARQDCLNDALNTADDEYGIRGGYSARERAKMRRARRLNGAA